MACVSDNIVGMDELLNRISLEEMHMLDEVILKKLIEPELEVEALPEEMYHYTSPNGLKGILESNSLWFTNY